MKILSESLLFKKWAFTAILGCEKKKIDDQVFEDYGVLREVYSNVLQLTDYYGIQNLKGN